MNKSKTIDVTVAKEINDAIISMINKDNELHDIDWVSSLLNEATEYEIDYESIEDIFRHCPLSEACPMKLSKKTIYNRLAIIDNLYGTNIVRMRNFGIADLTDVIWKLCNDGCGNHTDFELTKKAENFVATYSSGISSNSNNLVNDAFTQKYGLPLSKAPSIISKYLYFLLQANHTNGIGFPIYDSLVCKIAPKIAKKLGVTHYTYCSDIKKYTFMLSEIVKVLEAQNPILWNKQNPRKTKFALLDHFLWKIGKVKVSSFSLLLTKQEYDTYKKSNKTILPGMITSIQSIIKSLNL